MPGIDLLQRFLDLIAARLAGDANDTGWRRTRNALAPLLHAPLAGKKGIKENPSHSTDRDGHQEGEGKRLHCQFFSRI